MAAVLGVSCSPENGNEDDTPDVVVAQVGQPLPLWSEGYLDIHSINSARGECTFYVYPDGTTMLVDAGEFEDNDATTVDKKPDAGTRAFVTYSKYIGHFIPEGHKTIDYALLTHFHMDHMGEVEADYQETAGGYVNTGISAVYSMIKYDKLVDRGYPDYTANPIAPESTSTPNYIAFVNYARLNDGLEVEQFERGSDTQFAMLYSPGAYDFSVTNIVSNGIVWQGEGVPELNTNAASENACSCGFLLRYGKFDYFAGGDLVSAASNRTAEYIGESVKRLEACKANHHLSSNAMGDTWMENTAPQVIVSQSFYKKQPDIGRLTDILSDKYYVGRKSVFLTNVHDETLKESADVIAGCTAYQGHVVLRVSPGGNEFYVYLLDDSDFSYNVKSVHGPYKCY